MQSSSQLFPARLMVSEAHRHYSEDTYLLKPMRAQDRSVEIAVTCITPINNLRKDYCPIICLHGMFQNRTSLLPASGRGGVEHLVSAGYQVWLPEIRGHGRSPINHEYSNNTFEDIVQHDIVAINEFVIEQANCCPIWIGHTFGAYYIAAALARGYIPNEKVAGMVMVGAQGDKPHWLLNVPLGTMLSSWMIKKKPFIEGYKLRYGPENEPGKFVSEVLRWQTRRGWKAADKFNYLDALSSVNVPTLSINFNEESTQQNKVSVLHNSLGSENKSTENLTLPDINKLNSYLRMVLGQYASQQVWPRVLQWCNKISDSCSEQVA